MADKRILMVIAPMDFRDEEFFEPYQHFTQQRHWDVTVATTTPGVAKGMLGKTWPVDETISGQKAEDYDALVIVGGMGSPTYLWENADLRQLVRDFNQQQKIVSAICLSGVVLANAGILQGKKATVWEMPESLAAYEMGKAQYVKHDVVADGNIVTANGPQAATPFAQEIAKHLLQVTAR